MALEGGCAATECDGAAGGHRGRGHETKEDEKQKNTALGKRTEQIRCNETERLNRGAQTAIGRASVGVLRALTGHEVLRGMEGEIDR